MNNNDTIKFEWYTNNVQQLNTKLWRSHNAIPNNINTPFNNNYMNFQSFKNPDKIDPQLLENINPIQGFDPKKEENIIRNNYTKSCAAAKRMYIININKFAQDNIVLNDLKSVIRKTRCRLNYP